MSILQVLEPKGILDSSLGNQVRREAVDLLEAGADTILLDLQGITFMDSSGLGALVAILQRAKLKGAKLYLASINEQVRIILELTKMDRVFDIVSDRSAL